MPRAHVAQGVAKQRMHLKEVVNLHWTPRKGIKLGEKYVSSSRFFGGCVPPSATTKFGNEGSFFITRGMISREFIPRSNPLTFVARKPESGGDVDVCIHGGIKHGGGTMFVPSYFSRSDKSAIEMFGKIAK